MAVGGSVLLAIGLHKCTDAEMEWARPSVCNHTEKSD